jgi:DNA excision repair protein ERCC-4
MENHQYLCNHCNYLIETRGPWPYFNSAGQIQGLMALVFCPECDKIKEYTIVKYERPLSSWADIWLSDVPRETKTVCHKCKKPVYLIIPHESVKCPRCKNGTFENFEPFEGDFVRSPVPPPQTPLRVKQNGKTIRIPKPTVVIDSAEHMGFKFERFTNWFTGTVHKRLPVGDYTLLGMEEEVAVERKTVPDLVNSIIQDRKDFIGKCERLSGFKKKCLVIEGSLSSIKTPYEDSQAHPNAVLGSLLAAQERWDIPVYFLDDFLLAEEFVASMLSKYHAFRWLEMNGFQRCLIEGDI